MKAGVEKDSERIFFLAKEGQVQAFDRRFALRGSLLSIGRVDTHQALRMWEDRQVEVDASEVPSVSYVFFFF